MGHYYFHIRNYGRDRTDDNGMDLPDLASALEQATSRARAMMCTGLMDGRLLLAPWIDISSEDGEVLACLPFAEAIDTIYMARGTKTPRGIRGLLRPRLTHDPRPGA